MFLHLELDSDILVQEGIIRCGSLGNSGKTLRSIMSAYDHKVFLEGKAKLPSLELASLWGLSNLDSELLISELPLALRPECLMSVVTKQHPELEQEEVKYRL